MNSQDTPEEHQPHRQAGEPHSSRYQMKAAGIAAGSDQRQQNKTLVSDICINGVSTGGKS